MTKRNYEPAAADVALRDFVEGDELRIVSVLAECHAGVWHDAAYWRWKHQQRPGFDPGHVLCAEAGAQLVGCFHSAVFPLRLEPGLHVPASFDGDFAVVSTHRKRDIPTRGYDIADPRLLHDHVALRGGFTSEELNRRFYHRRYGYVFVPTATLEYQKVIGLGPLQRRVSELGSRLLDRGRVRDVLARSPLRINLDIESLPPCHLVLAAEGIALEPGHPSAGMAVRAPYRLVLAGSEGGAKTVAAVARLALSGRLRLRGLFRSLPTLGRILWAARTGPRKR